VICPECHGPIPRSGWTPFNVHGQLTVAWRCPNGHHGQHNRVGMLLPPKGEPAANQLPPMAPVDWLDI